MKGGAVGWILNKSWSLFWTLALIATGLVLVVGTSSTMSLAQNGMSALGDGVKVVIKTVPVFFDHAFDKSETKTGTTTNGKGPADTKTGKN